MFIEENPDASIDDILAHYGVLGMKWGVRRAKADAYDIRSARARLATKNNKLQKAKRSAASINDPQKRAAAKSELAKMKTAFFKDPERVVAARLTRGEKAVAFLFLTPLGAAGLIGATSARSRRIERKQELGKYGK